MPSDVITRAREILASIEKSGTPSPTVEGVSETIRITNEISENNNRIFEKILNTDLSTITPIEALNELYKLQKEVKELNEN